MLTAAQMKRGGIAAAPRSILLESHAYLTSSSLRVSWVVPADRRAR